jgi:uncharacterized repeat protein (TIGR03803 family)
MIVAVRLRAGLVALCVTALAGCGGNVGSRVDSGSPLVPSGARSAQRQQPQTQPPVTVLYNFQGGSADGGYPYASLVADKSGALYGTTNGGGPADLGTVFKLTPSGSKYTESILHSFGGTGDGSLPYGSLLLGSGGVLYGTTYSGGKYGDGCVYALTPSGKSYTESVVYSFGGSPDGGNPYAGLSQNAAGTLFGTTLYGGLNGFGAVFALTPSGGSYKESVLYSFDGGKDGATPYGGILSAKSGVLYGTTFAGGENGDGTVYALTPSGKTYAESIVYSFAGGAKDGANPYAALVASGDLVFGTTAAGGTAGDGTAFQVKLAKAKGKSKESVLHSFGGTGDASQPYGALLLGADDALYGATFAGGADGQGAIFELSKSGKTYAESVVASFPGYPGAANAYAGVIASSTGTLLGTTFGGGDEGYGTVFEVTP